ncbi:DNA-binding protein [Cupriavidus basilensis]|uniref:DNA-binding protein n=1 Tax=Cupriavidus basilensis TaxID=68895 RepID=A0ABT6AKQ7_9BURK|nr:DNA-binding protein [Cupriavidus basilensis]MDF3833197.1 DNA-binding protein [Cupriavidus basilensis]
MDAEQQLQAEIDTLRLRIANTQDLYVQACHVMFFRFGVTPTATRLYQLVRKGSMTTVSEAVRQFWAQLREKSRILVDHAGLPDDIRGYAGEILAELWHRAVTSAETNAARLKDEAEQALVVMQGVLTATQRERDNARLEVEAANGRRDEEARNARALEQQLSAAGAQIALLERELQSGRSQTADAQAALAGAQRDFSAELEKLREDARIVEERMAGTERRVLLEVDRHRTQTAALQKELDNARQEQVLQRERLQAETERYEREAAQERERASGLQGSFQAVCAERDRLLAEDARNRQQIEIAAAEARTLRQKLVAGSQSRETLAAARRRQRLAGRKVPGA